MGCGSSSEGTQPGSYQDDKDLQKEAKNRRIVLDKKQGFAVQAENEEGVPDYAEGEEEDPLFEEQDETVQEFMAVRPWIGQVTEPSQHNPVDKSKPDT